MMKEIHEINLTFSGLLEKLGEDLDLAERLQKARLPKRFPKLKGFRVSSRYLAGMKSGGDYFDLAESRDGKNLGIVLSHSSTYGLSSAFLSLLMRVAVKISAEQLGISGSVSLAIQKIHEELLLVLKEKDTLSLIYGSILRSERIFRYVNLGESLIFLSQSLDSEFEELPSHGPSFSKGLPSFTGEESVVQLDPDSRLVMISGGAVEGLGGKSVLLSLLNRFRKKEPADFLNEVGFQIKSKLQSDDDMPEKDCTAILVDADSRVFKLTKREPSESST
jgi:serine phosphatase RsbU (regulator of sigma subunit)